jgi:hypothetical protein
MYACRFASRVSPSLLPVVRVVKPYCLQNQLLPNQAESVNAPSASLSGSNIGQDNGNPDSDSSPAYSATGGKRKQTEVLERITKTVQDNAKMLQSQAIPLASKHVLSFRPTTVFSLALPACLLYGFH